MYFDWVGSGRKSLELEVNYSVTSHDTVVYTQTSYSKQTTSKSTVPVSPLITATFKECIAKFIKGAQDAKVF